MSKNAENLGRDMTACSPLIDSPMYFHIMSRLTVYQRKRKKKKSRKKFDCDPAFLIPFLKT